jgi:thymidine kinase
MAELHIIFGCMYSGKSSELLKIISRYKLLGKNVLCINHMLDTRYGKNKIISHDRKEEYCFQVDNLTHVESLENYDNSEIIIIEEGHFFKDLVSFVKNSLKKNKKIYVAGLNGDYQQKSIGFINELIPLCDSVKKLDALCLICKDGTKAIFTKRITDSTDQFIVGSTETYIPVCRKHY